VALRNKFERPLKAAKADPGITKMLSQNVSDKQLRNSRLKDKKHDYEGIPTGRKLNKILNKKNKVKT
jgi:hypothetical protein